MSLPSIRECEQRLQALRAAQPDAAALQRAVAVCEALLHYVNNAGTPPAVPPTPKQRAMSLVPRSRPESVPMHLARRPEPRPAAPAPAAVHAAPPAPKAKRLPIAIPPDRVTKAQLVERSGYSRSYIDLLLTTGALEKPIEPGSNVRPALWTEDQAVRIVAQLKSPAARKALNAKRPRKPLPEVPAGWVSADEFAQRLGCPDPNRVHLLVHDGRITPAPHRQARRVFWDEAYVAQIVSTLVIQRRKPRQG